MFVCLRVYTSASLFRQSIVFCSGYVIDSIASLNRERQKESGKNTIFVHEYVARINLRLHTRLYAGNRKSCLNANECKADEKRVSSITRFFYVSVKTNDRSKRAERQYEYRKKKKKTLFSDFSVPITANSCTRTEVGSFWKWTFFFRSKSLKKINKFVLSIPLISIVQSVLCGVVVCGKYFDGVPPNLLTDYRIHYSWPNATVVSTAFITPQK